MKEDNIGVKKYQGR